MKINHQWQPGIIRKDPDWVADHVLELSSDFFNYTGNILIGTTHNGKIIRSDDLANVVYTLPNSLPVGFNVGVIQRNTGQITFIPEAGAILRNPYGWTKTYGRYAFVGLVVMDNLSGSAAEWLLTGNAG